MVNREDKPEDSISICGQRCCSFERLQANTPQLISAKKEEKKSPLIQSRKEKTRGIAQKLRTDFSKTTSV